MNMMMMIYKYIFKRSNIGIAFRTTNTIFKQLSLEGCTNQDPSDIYKIKCNTCNKAYVGQTVRAISVRYREHIRYIRTNNPQSAYATHILQNRHEFGPQNETLQLIKTCAKGMRMNCWESISIQNFHRKCMLITEQQPYDHNPLYDCIQETGPRTDNHKTEPTQSVQDTHQQRNTGTTYTATRK